MADSNKNILITPATGTTSEPVIEFKGYDVNTDNITLTVLDDGSLSFDGMSGQLFSMADTMSGTIYSVNDVSGIPSIEVIDDGTVKIAPYAGNVVIGKTYDSGDKKVQIVGDISVSGDITASSFTTSISPVGHITSYVTLTNTNNVAGGIGYIVDTTSGDVALTLPPPSEMVVGGVIEILDKTFHSSGNDIILTPNGSDTIDGVSASVVLSDGRYYSWKVVYIGGNDWRIVRSPTTNPTRTNGSSTFVGNGSERTIAHGLGVTPSSVSVNATANPGGYLGETWIRYDATNIYVGNSGSFTGAFAWTAFH